MSDLQDQTIEATPSDKVDVLPVNQSVDYLREIQNKAVNTGELVDIVDVVKYLYRMRLDTLEEEAENFYHYSFEEASAWVHFAEDCLGHEFPEIMTFPNERVIPSDTMRYLNTPEIEKRAKLRAAELMRIFSNEKEKSIDTRESDPWSTVQKNG